MCLLLYTFAICYLLGNTNIYSDERAHTHTHTSNALYFKHKISLKYTSFGLWKNVHKHKWIIVDSIQFFELGQNSLPPHRTATAFITDFKKAAWNKNAFQIALPKRGKKVERAPLLCKRKLFYIFAFASLIIEFYFWKIHITTCCRFSFEWTRIFLLVIKFLSSFFSSQFNGWSPIVNLGALAIIIVEIQWLCFHVRIHATHNN